jgi:hypothetical protein
MPGADGRPQPAPVPVAERYRRFAEREARGRSPLYERFALGVADDPELLALLARLPPAKQQPNLLFAAVLYLGGRQPDYRSFRAFVLDHADQVVATMLARRTQTNEVGRCALLLPLLAALPGPLALVEVGASAGLCLLPDRYAHDYAGTIVGDPAAPLRLACQPYGPVPIPARPPEVIWRRGIDLAPIDLDDPDAVRWLECCVWPDQPERLARLQAAVEVARADPPQVLAGDLLELVGSVVAQAPTDTTVVVFHAATLVYLPEAGRRRFAELMAGLRAVWISAEGPGVVPGLDARLGRAPVSGGAVFLLGQGPDQLVGLADPHGAWLQWLNPRLDRRPDRCCRDRAIQRACSHSVMDDGR